MTTPTLVGTWALVGGTLTAADGSALPVPYGPMGMGRISFSANGQMVAVVCDCRPEMPAGAVREYNSYCGSYTFDGRRLVTRVFANSDPTRLAVDQVRDIRFEGRRMVMRPVPHGKALSAVPQREIWWEKIADV